MMTRPQARKTAQAVVNALVVKYPGITAHVLGVGEIRPESDPVEDHPMDSHLYRINDDDDNEAEAFECPGQTKGQDDE